jgi:hypothetical protein
MKIKLQSVNDDWHQNSKNKFQKLHPRSTKNSLNFTKRISKKAYLEPKLFNFGRCSCVPTKLSLKKQFIFYLFFKDYQPASPI